MPDLTAALRAVLSEGVALGVGGDAPLWPGEALPGAVPARLTEFRQGRAAARAAMAALGVAPAAIPMRADRSPAWPEGVTGSISHCAGACMAIAARSARYAGIGLDIEPAAPLPADLWPVILRDDEQDEQGVDPLAVFVAKEAAYKAQYPVTRALFDFHTLSVTVTDDRFVATFRHGVAPFAAGHVLQGRLVRTPHHIAAVCALPA